VSDLLARVTRLPGVSAAAVVNELPMESIQMNGFRIEGQPTPPPGQGLTADTRNVSEEYIGTMGMRIMSGRGFTRAETEKINPTEVIVNESLARKLWPNESPLGKVLKAGKDGTPGAWRRAVIGVVSDTRQLGLDVPPRTEMFFPVRNQFPRMVLVARTAGDPMRMVPAVSAQVWAIDKDQPVHDIYTMDYVVNQSISQRRFNMLLLAAFAGTALLLAAVGIYGVLAYAVSRRTQEIGIRMALGAQTRDILRLVGTEGLRLVVIGIAIGLAGAMALTRLMASLLFGVSATDGLTFAAVPAVLAAVALAACYLPARRATRIEPTVALRYD